MGMNGEKHKSERRENGEGKEDGRVVVTELYDGE